jgi:starch synthase
LKAGLVYADALTTVSPRYSREIQTAKFGLGMDGILRRRADRLFGILNGADYAVWNPAGDPYIPVTYTAEDPGGKQTCKAGLLKEMGLGDTLLGAPLCGVVSRLTVQKGFELIAEAVDEIVDLGAGLVILGSGEPKYEEAVRVLQEKHPGRIALRLGFDESLAHRIMAGSDMLLVPSLYEPCGLTQIHAMKYGTVPLVRATGGLDDTVEAFDPRTGSGTGFKFSGNRAADFLAEIGRAVQFYEDRSAWMRIMANGMAADFSWTRSAGRYVDLYRELTE